LGGDRSQNSEHPDEFHHFIKKLLVTCDEEARMKDELATNRLSPFAFILRPSSGHAAVPAA